MKKRIILSLLLMGMSWCLSSCFVVNATTSAVKTAANVTTDVVSGVVSAV